MPKLPNFSLTVVREELERIGIYLVEDYGNQTLWAVQTINYQAGDYGFASEVEDGRYDLPAVRSILNQCGKAGEMQQVEELLLERQGEGLEEPPQEPQDPEIPSG
jgi:hypothetical protein